MTEESAFIDLLRSLTPDPAARSLMDDAAVLEVGATKLVLTHDMIVEGVHFLAGDPPEDVAWKLVAVNLSDLAAKGARPLGLLVGYTLSPSDSWNQGFVRGLQQAVDALGAPLLGGDTVSAPAGAARSFGLTAIGVAAGPVPCRTGAKAGDALWVSGTIGDAGAGLKIAQHEMQGPESLLDRYRRPQPRLEAGQMLAPVVGAMMDVSDGLLIDAGRMAQASRLAIQLQLEAIPLSDAYRTSIGEDRTCRTAAATAGDDYELLFSASEGETQAIERMSETLALPLTKIGRFSEGSGIALFDASQAIPLPDRMGWEHGSA